MLLRTHAPHLSLTPMASIARPPDAAVEGHLSGVPPPKILVARIALPRNKGRRPNDLPHIKCAAPRRLFQPILFGVAPGFLLKCPTYVFAAPSTRLGLSAASVGCASLSRSHP